MRNDSRFARNLLVAARGAALLLFGLGSIALQGCRSSAPADQRQWPAITLTPQDRILVLAPHPDDEVLGCGGIIQHAVTMGLPVRVVFLTYGDNNEWSFLIYRKRPVVTPNAIRRMGLVRHDEALAAARVLGLSADQLTFLGYPDFGTLEIWERHWGEQPPFRSMLTRVAVVPYANALRPGAPYKGEEIVQDLTTVLREFRPTKVFVSHPGDHMPDHRALYLFARVALWDLESKMTPEFYPYLIHFKRWPRPKGYRPTAPLGPPALFQGDIAWASHLLNPNEVEHKRMAIRAHRSQYGSSAKYLLSFIRPNELFGDFPAVPLRLNPTTVPLVSNGHTAASVPPEELTDVERAAFVGVEERSVRLDGGNLVLSIEFTRPLAQAVIASVYIFGYRHDQPFARLPKLHITFSATGHAIYNQARRLPNDLLQITREPRRLTLRIPLQILGNPERILTGARTYLGEIPLDWVSWRILELSTSR